MFKKSKIVRFYLPHTAVVLYCGHVLPNELVMPVSLFKQGSIFCFLSLQTNIAFHIRLISGITISKSFLSFTFNTQTLPWQNKFVTFHHSILECLKKFINICLYGFYKNLQFVGFRYRQRCYRDLNVVRYRLGYN